MHKLRPLVPRRAKPLAQSSAGAIDVLSNTQGVNFGPYLKDVKDAVRKNWYRVIPLSVQMGRQGKVCIEFIILRDGRVKGMTLSSTSGDVALDRAAWAGITASDPFAPLPNEFTGQYLKLRFHFYYSPSKNTQFEGGAQISETQPSSAPGTQNPSVGGGESQSPSDHTRSQPTSSQGNAQASPSESETDNNSDKREPGQPIRQDETVYEVGHGITAPHPIHTPNPEYTDRARKKKLQGTVLVALVVTSEGEPRDVAVIKKLDPGLDGKAMEAVRSWKFEPATKDGKPVAVHLQVEVQFRLC